MSYWTKKLDEQVIQILQSGGVGLLPSDTIYGLSCLALDQKAVERIYELKGRQENKPFIVLIANISQLSDLKIHNTQSELIKDYWPGALTMVFQAADSPDWLHRGGQTLAVRLPKYSELQGLIAKVGPIVSTSANPIGKGFAKSAAEAKGYFADKLDFYVDVGELDEMPPSTVVKAVNHKLEIIRQGSVKIN